MSIPRLGSASLPAVIPSDPLPQRSQPAPTAGAGLHGGVSGLPNKPPASAPQGPLGELSLDLLREVVRRTVDLDGPLTGAVGLDSALEKEQARRLTRQVASQLERLKPVSKAFSSAAGDIVSERQEVHHTALVNRVMHAIKGAEDEWARSGWAPADKERIGVRLAAALQNLDHVIVRLDRIGHPSKPEGPWDLSRIERRPQMIEMFMDVLAMHSGLRALEATAMENQQLSCIAEVVGRRPDLLRSLVVRTTTNSPWSGNTAEATHARAELSRVLPCQKNLTTLDLQHAGLGTPGREPLNLRDGGLDEAIAALPGLRRLALSHHQLKPDDANALAAVLRQLPALQDLDLIDIVLDAADFSQIASSLPAVPRLRSLDLQGTLLAGASAGHLAHVLPGLAELQALNLADTGLVAADMEHLAGGLAGLKQLRTLDISCNQLDQDGRSLLIAALAQVPTLRHLHLRARLHERLPNLDTLRADLSPLAGHQDLQVYLRTPHEFDKPGRQRMARHQAEMSANSLPRIHFIG